MFFRSTFARNPSTRLAHVAAPCHSIWSVKSRRHASPVCRGAVAVSTYGNKDTHTRSTSGLGCEVTDSCGSTSYQKAVPLQPLVAHRLTPTMKKFTLLNRVAVVAGGARGLGFDIAQGFAEAGIQGIALIDVSPEDGEEAAKMLAGDTGVETRFCQADIRDSKHIQQAVDEIVEHFGRIDILVNSAGIADSNIKSEDYEPERFRRVLDINLTGLFLVSQAVGRKMIERGEGGCMINIASMSGSIVNYPQCQCAYNASKAGVIQLTRSLAAEWAKHHIRVNSISPGYMDTKLNQVPKLNAQKKIWMENTPLKRIGAAHELRNLAIFLASEGSSFMIGSDIKADGGYTLW